VLVNNKACLFVCNYTRASSFPSCRASAPSGCTTPTARPSTPTSMATRSTCTFPRCGHTILACSPNFEACQGHSGPTEPVHQTYFASREPSSQSSTRLHTATNVPEVQLLRRIPSLNSRACAAHLRSRIKPTRRKTLTPRTLAAGPPGPGGGLQRGPGRRAVRGAD